MWFARHFPPLFPSYSPCNSEPSLTVGLLPLIALFPSSARRGVRGEGLSTRMPSTQPSPKRRGSVNAVNVRVADESGWITKRSGVQAYGSGRQTLRAVGQAFASGGEARASGVQTCGSGHQAFAGGGQTCGSDNRAVATGGKALQTGGKALQTGGKALQTGSRTSPTVLRAFVRVGETCAVIVQALARARQSYVAKDQPSYTEPTSRGHRARARKIMINHILRVTLRSPGATILRTYGAMSRRLRARDNTLFILTGLRNHAHRVITSQSMTTPN